MKSNRKADPRKEFYERLMHTCERAWRAGNLPAIVDAVEYCAKANGPPPPWLVTAIATLVSRQMLVRTGRGRFNSRQAVFDENQKHHARWDMVRELRDRRFELFETSMREAAKVRARRPEFEALGISPTFLDEAERINDSVLTLDKAFARVSEELHGTFAEGTEDAVKYSYNLVEQKLAEGRGAEFYIARFKPNGKSG